MTQSELLQGFPPITGQCSRILILGSMPSETSLRKQQYYGHPRNAFWTIVQELFSIDRELDYGQRKLALVEKGIAVWDVLKCCHREGSMDADIDVSSIEVNDFTGLFSAFPLIREVCFNGGMAEKLFRKHVLPGITPRFSYLQYRRLPSTSPAYASMSVAEKISAWQVIK